MVLSAPPTTIQLGFALHAGVVTTALKLSAALSTCDRAMKAACSTERSAAKYSWNWFGSRYVKPSAVFFIAPDLLRSPGSAFRRPLRSLQRLACALQHTPIPQPMDL